MNVEPHDDSLLTAYAVGELDAAESAAVEARLAEDPEARRAVEEIRRLSGAIRQARAEEPLPENSAALREQLETDAAEAATSSTPAKADAPVQSGTGNRGRGRRVWIALSLVATILIAVVIVASNRSYREVALTTFNRVSERIRGTDEKSSGKYGNRSRGDGDRSAYMYDDTNSMGELGRATHNYHDINGSLLPIQGRADGSANTPFDLGDRIGGRPGDRGPSPTRTPPARTRDVGGGGFDPTKNEGDDGGGSNFSGSPSPDSRVLRPRLPRPSMFPPREGREDRPESPNEPAGDPATDGPAPAGKPTTRTSGDDDDDDDDDGDPSDEAGESGQQGEGEGKDGDKGGKLGDEGKSASQKTWRRAAATPNASRLMIGDREELPLEGMQANVQIDGFRARVLLDLYFFNDRQRQFEGTFKIRLPSEASLYYFAFGETEYKSPDVPRDEPVFFSVERSRNLNNDPKAIAAARSDSWPDPKEARMVPREKAAYAYRETVRRRVDPALVEWAGAGVFSARVFPLAPQKLHRIVIGYDVNLLEVDEDLLYRLDLPESLTRCVVDLRVAALGKTALSIKPAAEPVTASHFRHYRFTNPQERTIELRMKKPGALMLVGEEDGTGPLFAARFQPKLPGDDIDKDGVDAKGKAALRDGVFLVDTSLSSNPDRFNIYLKLLEAVLSENRDSMRRFSVLYFNVESHWWREAMVDNTPENVEALIDDALTLSLEGATDLDMAIAEAVRPAWPKSIEKPATVDYFLLSDGAMTWGQLDARRIAERLQTTRGSLFAYSTGLSGDNTALLAYLAAETGGSLFPVVGEDQITKVATAHRSRPWRLEGVSLPGGSDLLLAGRPRVIYPGQTLLLTGRGAPSGDAEITLRLERAGEKKVVKTKLDHVVDTELASRVYGQVAVAGLESLPTVSRDMATAYARQFRITGQMCSLLMLESEADYERFGIKPEEDAFVVKSSPASKLMERALKDAKEKLADPRARFIAWLDRLEKMPGMTMQISPALRVAIDSMPESSFTVQSRPLRCDLLRWTDLPGAFQDGELSARPLSYDAVTREALRRFKKAGRDDALRALSSLVEMSPGDGVLARDVAFTAVSWGRADQAFGLFQRVALSRPYEPQTYHAMARSLAEMGKVDLAMLYYEVAVSGKWDGRFGEFNRIVGLDYLRFLRRIDDGAHKTSTPEFARARLDSIEARYSIGRPDLVVTMSWNTDGTDVDMHLIEPTGEDCNYQHTDTRIGGHLSSDVTQGFGPEMYVLRKAVPGTYRVRAHYYSSDANRATTRTRVHVTIVRNWGGKNESVSHQTVTLTEGKQMHDVAEIVVK